MPSQIQQRKARLEQTIELIKKHPDLNKDYSLPAFLSARLGVSTKKAREYIRTLEADGRYPKNKEGDKK